MNQAKSKALSVWIYCGEYIAATIIYSILFLVFEPAEISVFVIKSSELLFSKFTFLMLTATIGFYWIFYKQSDSDFAKWLYKKNAYDTYSRVFLSTIAIYFTTSFLLAVTELSKNMVVANITGWIILLALINVFTFFKNISELMRLKTYFQIKLEEEKG